MQSFKEPTVGVSGRVFQGSRKGSPSGVARSMSHLEGGQVGLFFPRWTYLEGSSRGLAMQPEKANLLGKARELAQLMAIK